MWTSTSSGETLYLAAKSLESISEDFVLDISHMELLSEEIKALSVSPDAEKEILKCLGEKNVQGIKRICAAENADEKAADILVKTASLYGDMKKVVSALKEIDFDKIAPYVAALEKIAAYFENSGLEIKNSFRFFGDPRFELLQRNCVQGLYPYHSHGHFVGRPI